MSELQLARQIITTNLSFNFSVENVNELYEIQSGNKQILYEHIKALSSIFNKAKEQLEKELESDNK